MLRSTPGFLQTVNFFVLFTQVQSLLRSTPGVL